MQDITKIGNNKKYLLIKNANKKFKIFKQENLKRVMNFY